MHRAVTAVAVALLVLLAGCTAGTGNDPSAGTSAAPGGGVDDADGTAGDGGAVARGGTVDFYVSDSPIEAFAHLNVTISRVGFHRTGDGGGEWVEFGVENRTVDLTRLVGANATLVDSFDVPNGSYDKVFLYVSDVEGILQSTGNETRVKLPSEKLQINKGFTVGPNASVEFVFDVSVHKAGNSGKHILKPVVGESGTDVTIESVDGDEPGERDRGEGDDRDEGDDEGDEDAAEGDNRDEGDEEGDRGDEEGDQGDGDPDEGASALNVSFAGSVTPGANATLVVTSNGSAVANATVTVNGDRVGTTDERGQITVAVPDADELEVRATAGEREAEIERELHEDDEDEGGGDR